jgi:predicted tellurium resistance membrane protein TerC
MEWIANPQIWIGLLTLTSLEIVLGIDNVVFISIVAGRLPAGQQDRARRTGLALAMFMRGGLFLIAKSTREIHLKLEEGDEHGITRKRATFGAVLLQILLLDLIFSLDSVITAVGMVDHVAVMIVAIMLAVAMMMFFAGMVSRFVERHPTIKMLALSFLLLIGVNLIGDGLGFHIPKGYTYFAMGFSIFVEMLNLKVRKRRRATAAA